MTASFKKIRSSLHSRYDAEARNEWQGPSPRLSAWATQLQKKRRNGGVGGTVPI